MNRAQLIKHLTKVSDDEPLFLIRAQDALGDETVRYWTGRAKQIGVAPEKVEDAEHIAREMAKWPVRKIPD